jgi:pimeloyl-ACP methyl ester carboxylesterase
MKLGSPTPKRLGQAFFAVAAILGCCGCAHLATVKITEPRVPTIAASDEELTSAKEFLICAEREQPMVSLADDLAAAKVSLNVLEQRPTDSSARRIYNFSVAHAVENVERTKIQPWQRKIDVRALHGQSPTGPAVDSEKFSLTSPRPIDADHDPSRYDLFPTDSLKISGKFFKTPTGTIGIGAPLVAVGRSENPDSRQQYELRRVYAPATAVLQFSGQKAELKFVDPFQTEKISLNQHVFPLAVDFNAPIAMLIARDRPERLGFSRLINPQKYADTARLTRLQPYDPARTPVIFVHGLQETPVSWTAMIESLRNNSWITEHYQFWVYSYPSGYPYPYSAALFRQDLDGVDRAFPNHKRFVLIGHSMGGMICRLMMTDSGDKIWRDFFSTPPAKTPLAPDARKLAEETLIFNHRRNVERVIFISTPHRGSKLASGGVGRLGAALVRTPRLFKSVFASSKSLLVADPAARTLKRMPNSVDTLQPNDRFVQAVNKLPITPRIPYHSIMGDRGRGDTPNSSDGIVPYWSSHLDGAQSELIVNSKHNAQYNPEAIREVERILKENLTAARN